MAMLANAVVLTSDGVGFVLSGEEMLRTKNGNDNSYNSSYEENEINYELKHQHLDMFENYQKLINFKKNTRFSELKIRKEYKRHVLVYDIKTESDEYIVIHKNGVEHDISFDLTGYELYLDTLNLLDKNAQLTNVKIQKYQTIIAKKM
jgi:pullulanase